MKIPGKQTLSTSVVACAIILFFTGFALPVSANPAVSFSPSTVPVSKTTHVTMNFTNDWTRDMTCVTLNINDANGSSWYYLNTGAYITVGSSGSVSFDYPAPSSAGTATIDVMYMSSNNGPGTNGCGGYSYDYGNIGSLSITSGPALPVAPSLSGTADTQTHLSWNTVTGADSYTVYRDGTSYHSGITTTTYDFDTGDSVSHTYTVRSVNSAGESTDSNSVSLTQTAPPPPPPSNSTPTDLTPRDVQLFATGVSIFIAWQIVNAFRYRSYD